MPSEDFNTSLQKFDPDRRLAALFARPDLRDHLFTLYAFNHEIARIAEATSESLIGEMKLTWWRDAIEDLYAPTPKVRRHDVTEGLAALTARLPKSALLALIEARQADIEARPFGSLDDVLAYADATAGSVAALALQICDVALDDHQVRAAGRAWGLTGLLRAFPHRARIGRAPVGLDRLTELGGNAAMLGQGLGEEKAAAARAPILDAARRAAADFAAAGRLPADAVPALAYIALVPSYLDRLPANPYQIAAEPGLLQRQLRLSWLSLTGR